MLRGAGGNGERRRRVRRMDGPSGQKEVKGMWHNVNWRGAMGCLVSFVLLAACATAEDQISSAERPGERGSDNGDGEHAFPPFTRVGGCRVVRQNGRIRLSEAGSLSLIQTIEEYAPPFALHVRAKTDSTNIRLYYNAGRVILNWEVRPKELRVHDLHDDRLVVRSEIGYIEPNTYHDIRWEIYPDGMRLLVNGREIMRKSGEYADLAAPVGIGPAFRSLLTV